jgi:hypothetical protein
LPVIDTTLVGRPAIGVCLQYRMKSSTVSVVTELKSMLTLSSQRQNANRS